MKRIAIVILNWNGAEMLQHFLPNVLANSLQEADVYVADNGSTDDSRAMLSRDYPDVPQILLPENFGFAEGYNQALKSLTHEFFLLLNSDVEVTPHWLEPLLAYMDAHPDVAACQPKLLALRNKEKFEYAGAAGGYLDLFGYPFCRGRAFDTVEEDHGQYDDAKACFWATGAALLIRREDWISSGGLDGRFFAHQEEIDLCWRLRSHNRGVACVPQSTVFHLGGGTLGPGNPRKTFLNFRNNLLMLYKNLPESQLHRVLRWRFWLDYLAALKFLLTGEGRHAVAVWKARKAFRKMRKEYADIRAENLRKTTLAEIPELMTASLLARYYLRGKKTFNDIFPQ